ncbi:hypothetical protein A9Q86_06835 [Flavobacteriales bacterium 33_180_T64]|nr:hypothetical protein A9Q86_06835 [Flavobacteriales bacterium 33_180_T64]
MLLKRFALLIFLLSFIITNAQIEDKNNETTFVAKWNNRSYDADVFILFTFDESGNATGVTIKHIAPITDFSFDFHNLNLKKQSN